MLLQESAAKFPADIKIGFEIEFRCLHMDGTNVDECMEGFSIAAGLRNQCVPIIEAIVEMLENSDIQVLQFHTEGSQGLFEISTGPLPPVEALDTLIYTRECIKDVFSKHNLIATMNPSPMIDVHHGTAAQFHISISPAGKSTSDSFLQGILSQLPALCALSLPLEVSYKRVNALESEAGAYVAWGTQNRDVPIRKIEDGHWEIRCCDGTANMYLVIAATLASGLEGIEQNAELRFRDFSSNPSFASEEQRLQAGIETKLPTSLGESLEHLKKANWTQRWRYVADAYGKLKALEMTALGNMDPKERKALLIRHF